MVVVTGQAACPEDSTICSIGEGSCIRDAIKNSNKYIEFGNLTAYQLLQY